MNENSTYHQTKAQLLDEQKAIEAAQKDAKHFEVLYNKYHEQIFFFIFKRTNDEDTAHDITSQVFLSALLNLYRYEFKGVPFSSWLFRIALNETNKHFIQLNSDRNVNIESEQLTSLSEELSFDENEEKIQKLISALKEINEETLQIVELRFFDQYSFKEIGEILDITENNAKVKLYRALDKLKNIITKK